MKPILGGIFSREYSDADTQRKEPDSSPQRAEHSSTRISPGWGDLPPRRRPRSPETSASRRPRTASIAELYGREERTVDAREESASATTSFLHAPRTDMTAELVAGILELRAKNVKKRDILAQLGCTNGVFDRWGLRGGWSRLPHELTRTLSRMTDYEQHRDRIQKSLQALDYYQDELPVPAIQKKKLLTAEQLALALEAIASRCDLGQKRRGKYIDELGTLVGVPGGTLASWISSKGKLNAPVRNLRNLPGFVLQCERLIASFQQVGAMDTAEEIRCMVLSDRRPIMQPIW